MSICSNFPAKMQFKNIEIFFSLPFEHKHTQCFPFSSIRIIVLLFYYYMVLLCAMCILFGCIRVIGGVICKYVNIQQFNKIEHFSRAEDKVLLSILVYSIEMVYSIKILFLYPTTSHFDEIQKMQSIQTYGE